MPSGEPGAAKAERAFAKYYAPGDVIQPERDYPRTGLTRGSLYEVVENGPATVSPCGARKVKRSKSAP